MKKLSLLLALVLIATGLTIPVGAREKSELQKVYTNLSQYMYAPYYSESELYEAYREEMKTTGELLAQSGLTETDIDLQYNALKTAYAALCRDVFDYSILDSLATDFEGLDISLYEEQSWRALSDVMDEIYNEISAPTMFKKGATTKESYTKKINDFINDFAKDFRNAFNALELLPLDSNMSHEQLKSLAHYCALSAQESIMGKSTYWSAYSSALTDAVAVSEDLSADTIKVIAAANSLLTAYKELSFDAFDFTPVKEAVEKSKKLSANQYTQPSWSRYETSLKAISTMLNEPQFFYLNHLPDDTDHNELIRSFFEKKTESANKYFEQLVKQEDINKLSALCNTYHNATASVGLDVKLQNLLTAVDNGYKILQDKNTSNEKVSSAISGIEEAAEDLDLAEKYLQGEQQDNFSNNGKTLQLIVILSVCALMLSLLSACYLSYRKFGRLNWYR